MQIQFKTFYTWVISEEHTSEVTGGFYEVF